MKIDYTVSASIVYDLSDAKEEIDSLLDLFDPTSEDVDEEMLNVGMAHLYFHINSAWNKRKLTDEQLSLIGGEDDSRLGEFPLDITPL